MEVRIAGITHESLVDGPGLRTVIWAQGCPHACPGCHNEHTQDTGGGELKEMEYIFGQIDRSGLAQGITLSGGEPFLQPAEFTQIAAYAKQKGLDVWAYTGYTMEKLLAMAVADGDIRRLLEQIDVLIDGPFVAAQKDLKLVFRGSANQRIIDVPASLGAAEPVLLRPGKY